MCQEVISSDKHSHALLQNDSCPLAPTHRSKSVTGNHLHDQRTHLAARLTTNQQIQFPIWSLCLYISLLLSIPLHQTTLSHAFHHSFPLHLFSGCFSFSLICPLVALSLSCHPSGCQGDGVLWRQLVRPHLSSCWPALPSFLLFLSLPRSPPLLSCYPLE